MADLKSCPWCGGGARVHEGGNWYGVGCDTIALGAMCFGYCQARQYPSAAEAAAAWNRRATPPSPSTAPIKDHVLREVVNSLRDVALQFHAHDSLRERLRAVLEPLLMTTPSTAPTDEAGERAAFEAWAQGRVTSLIQGKFGTGYVYADAARAWDAWQASAALAAKPAAEGKSND